MAGLWKASGDREPADSLMEHAEWDIFHPGAIIASELINSHGSYRNFMVSNKKSKRKLKHGILLMDKYHNLAIGLVKILRPKVIFSDIQVHGLGEEKHMIVDLFSKGSKNTLIIYAYGDFADKRVSLHPTSNWSE